jgi:hypothetical protein
VLHCHPQDLLLATRPERFLLPPFHLARFSASDRRDLEWLKAEPVSFASQFGWIFLNFVQFCKIGTAFVSKLNQMDAMIKDFCKSRSFEAKWLRVERGFPTGTGYDFLSFDVTPVQRYPRYPFLLRDLYKRTPDFYLDKPFLDAVFNVIDFVNKQIDQSSANENRKHDITTVQTLLEPNVKVMATGSQILRHTDVRLTKLRSAPGIIYLSTTSFFSRVARKRPTRSSSSRRSSTSDSRMAMTTFRLFTRGMSTSSSPLHRTRLPGSIPSSRCA